jgi:hypothetical protein
MTCLARGESQTVVKIVEPRLRARLEIALQLARELVRFVVFGVER